MKALAAILPGFRVARGWASDVALDDAVAAITWKQETIKIFGREVLQPRMTAWMGQGFYTYSGRQHAPAPTPALVATLRDRIQAVTGGCYNSVLANLYRDGKDSVAWHADDEPELGERPLIASLSLGSSRKFKVKERATGVVADVVLGHGDLLVMDGPSQRDYLHAVPKTRDAGPRVNLTFRLVR